MPLAIDNPRRTQHCFWLQDLRYETKADLMRHLYLITRHFAAVAFTLQENRETDAVRVVVAGALAAVMDALIRRSVGFLESQSPSDEQLNASQISLHYSGAASGPGTAFGLDPGTFAEISETLLFVAPEYSALRALVLDYFHSIRQTLDDSHVIFQFDRSMACSEGDRTFVEQVGLSLGVEGAHREAPMLITGERPDLIELFLEFAWFRDVVFLWKMLLLPTGVECKKGLWRASDSILQWSWKKDKFVVNGFDTALTAIKSDQAGLFGMIKSPLSWITGNYSSDSKAISAASPSALAGEAVKTEDDILFFETRTELQ
jgi:hypothetical protein